MAGTTYHVAKTGDNGNTGLSFAQAFLTVAKLTATWSSGDIAIFYDGTWSESEMWNNTIPGGTESDPTIVKVASGAETIFQGVTGNAYVFRMVGDSYVHILNDAGSMIVDGGGNGVSSSAGITHDLIRFSVGSTNCVINGPELRNSSRQNVGSGSTYAGVGVFIQDIDCTDNQLLNLVVHDNGTPVGGLVNQTHGIYVRAPNTIVEGCEVYNHAYGWGLHAYKSTNCNNNNIYRKNIFRDNVQGGAIVGAGNDQKFDNNLVYDNDGHGVILGFTSPQRPLARHNTVHGNGGYGFHVRSGTVNAGIYSNAITSNTSGAVLDQGSGTSAPTAGVNANYTGVSPAYVDATGPAYNFTPDTGSPLIDSVSPIGDVLDDFNGTTRPSGSAADQGAIEVSGAPPDAPSASHEATYTVTTAYSAVAVTLVKGTNNIVECTISGTGAAALCVDNTNVTVTRN